MDQFQFFAVLLQVILLLVIPVCGNERKLSASYTATLEKAWLADAKTYFIQTTALNYSAREYWDFTLIWDFHPTKGTDMDLSTTLYLPNPIFDVLYVTVGARKGLLGSLTPLISYGQVTFQF